MFRYFSPILALAMFGLGIPAAAEVCVTPSGGMSFPHDGSCGSADFSQNELQLAIYAAYNAGGGTVKIGQGCVCPAVTTFPGVTLEGIPGSEPIIEGVTVSGDGTDRTCSLKYLMVQGIASNAANLSVEDCFAVGSSSYGISVGNTVTKPAKISRCDIANNQAGGIFVRTTAEIQSCNIHDNGSGGVLGYAAGILANGNYGKVTVRNCQIVKNSAPSESLGGGIYADGDVEIRDCSIEANRGGFGGGILAVGRDSGLPFPNVGGLTVQISNCIVSQNVATFRPFTVHPQLKNSYYAATGGGIMCWTQQNGGKVVVSNSFIEQNRTEEGHGGGMVIRGCDVAVSDTRIAHNEAAGKGGGVSIQSFSPLDSSLQSISFVRCRITNNQCQTGGGGLHQNSWTGFFPGDMYQSIPAFLANCLVAGNTAASGPGGGIYTELMPLDLVNCTIANNGGTIGGGLHITDYRDQASLKYFHSSIDNCAITDNVAGEGSAVHYLTTIPVNAFNHPDPPTIWNCAFLTRDTFSGSISIPGINSQRNIYVSSAKYVNRLAGDFHLQAGSRLIDHGHFAHDTGTVDLDRKPRIVGVIDIGCYERPASPPVISVVGATARKFGSTVTVFLPLTNTGGSEAKNVTVSSVSADSASLIGYKPSGNLGSILVGEQIQVIADFNTLLQVGSRIRVRITGSFDGGSFSVVQYVLIQ